MTALKINIAASLKSQEMRRAIWLNLSRQKSDELYFRPALLPLDQNIQNALPAK